MEKIGVPKPSGPLPNRGITAPNIKNMPQKSGLLPRLKKLASLRVNRPTFKSTGVHD